MQVFIAYGRCADHDASYVYAFADEDEAMQFVEWASAHQDDAVTDWTILTETVHTARWTYDFHRAWVED